jgi:hypothetical protein
MIEAEHEGARGQLASRYAMLIVAVTALERENATLRAAAARITAQVLRRVRTRQVDETTRWQVEQARDLLSRWDRERGAADVIDREHALAGQVRAVLAAVDAAEASAADMERLAWQLGESERQLQEAVKRIEAGTRTLHALAALARTWEDQAGQHACPAAAQALQQCAAQLRQTVRQVHEITTQTQTPEG